MAFHLCVHKVNIQQQQHWQPKIEAPSKNYNLVPHAIFTTKQLLYSERNGAVHWEFTNQGWG